VEELLSTPALLASLPSQLGHNGQPDRRRNASSGSSAAAAAPTTLVCRAAAAPSAPSPPPQEQAGGEAVDAGEEWVQPASPKYDERSFFFSGGTMGFSGGRRVPPTRPAGDRQPLAAREAPGSASPMQLEMLEGSAGEATPDGRPWGSGRPGALLRPPGNFQVRVHTAGNEPAAPAQADSSGSAKRPASPKWDEANFFVPSTPAAALMSAASGAQRLASSSRRAFVPPTSAERIPETPLLGQRPAGLDAAATAGTAPPLAPSSTAGSRGGVLGGGAATLQAASANPPAGGSGGRPKASGPTTPGALMNR
jgi:hypothetical protein